MHDPGYVHAVLYREVSSALAATLADACSPPSVRAATAQVLWFLPRYLGDLGLLVGVVERASVCDLTRRLIAAGLQAVVLFCHHMPDSEQLMADRLIFGRACIGMLEVCAFEEARGFGAW